MNDVRRRRPPPALRAAVREAVIAWVLPEVIRRLCERLR